MTSTQHHPSLWIVTREYAGVAEAGGVKNVVKALAEAANEYGFSVTVFLPRYGCIAVTETTCIKTVSIRIANTLHTVRYFEWRHNGLKFILIDAELFSEKKDIYTYCAEELEFFREKLKKPELKKGEGYIDSSEMNILFQKAVYCYGLSRCCAPDILHCHDAHTALLPAFIFSRPGGKSLFKYTRALITIHNAGDGYRQTLRPLEYAASVSGLSHPVLNYGTVENAVEPFLVGARFAHLTTVSPWYAEQLEHPEQSPYAYHFSQVIADRHIHITGITNGIDFDAYDPRKTEISGLPFAFDIQSGSLDGKYACRSFLLEKLAAERLALPYYDGVQWFGSLAGNGSGKELYLAYHGRFVHQKGVEVLLNAASNLLEKAGAVRFILMGQGNTDFEAAAVALTERFAGRCVYCKGYNRKIARLITAAADFMILPSLFEPCGLEDLIAQIYGTIPIAHAQGGLQKITHGKTGFLYTIPPDDGFRSEKDRHTEILCKTVLQQIAYIDSAPQKYVLDIPLFRTMILQAYQELHTVFSWKIIFADHYRKLYDTELQRPCVTESGAAFGISEI